MAMMNETDTRLPREKILDFIKTRRTPVNMKLLYSRFSLTMDKKLIKKTTQGLLMDRIISYLKEGLVKPNGYWNNKVEKLNKTTKKGKL